MATVYKPLKSNIINGSATKIFLAGSIEMGKAVDWQTKLSEDLSEFDVDIYNPRRDAWDATWEQIVTNDNFTNQVTWELDHLDAANAIVFYFDENSKSPITLLELGLYVNSGKPLFICCPPKFWRRGNVEIVCDRFGITLYEEIEELKVDLFKYLSNGISSFSDFLKK